MRSEQRHYSHVTVFDTRDYDNIRRLHMYKYPNFHSNCYRELFSVYSLRVLSLLKPPTKFPIKNNLA